MIQCVIFVVEPLLPMSTSRLPNVIHVMSETRPFLFFTVSSTSVYHTEHNRGGLEMRLFSCRA